MSKQSPFAREDVMEDYLDSLLKEPAVSVGVSANQVVSDNVEMDDATVRAAKLLEQASQHIANEPLVKSDVPLSQNVEIIEPAVASEKSTTVEDELNIEEVQIREIRVEDDITPADENAAHAQTKIALKDSLDFRFQALFFEVAGLTLAVPLTTLGGIHQIDKIAPLFGKPDWFMGVMLHRESKLNVVDSAKWVMPEKYNEALAESLDYRYLIMLGESAWGLASEKLVNTVNLTKDDVKWRESTGKRPWLAGMVKEKMCALIDVEELISMLNKGLGSNDQTP